MNRKTNTGNNIKSRETYQLLKENNGTTESLLSNIHQTAKYTETDVLITTGILMNLHRTFSENK